MNTFLRSICAAVVLSALPVLSLAQVIVNPNDATLIRMPSDPQGAIRTARESVAAGNLPGAIRELARYVNSHQNEPDPARLLGDLYYRAGNLREAEATYQRILMMFPGDKETHNRLGSVFATENRVDDAIAEFRRSLPGTDSVPDLVRLYERKGQLRSYENELVRNASEFPTDTDIQNELGQLYEATYRPQLALVAFRRALDNAPNSLMAMNGLGLSYLDEHDYLSALDYFKRCLVRYQSYSCADNLGAAYLEMGNWTAAETVLAQARDLQPERSEALVNFGYLSDSRGDWKKAIAYYISALTVYPYSTDAYIDLGYTYEQHKLYGLAQSVLLKGLVVTPTDGRLHFLLGQTYADQHQTSLANAQFRAAADSADPDVKRLAQMRVEGLGGKPKAP